MFELPVARGLMLCELYIVDTATTNVTLVNQFTRMKSDTFPTDPKKFTVYATLADGQGDVAMRLEVAQLSTAGAIWQTVNRLRIPDRLTTVRYAVTLTGVIFPEPGEYEIVLYAGNEPIAHTGLRLLDTTGATP